jgi:hypothetical protein
MHTMLWQWKVDGEDTEICCNDDLLENSQETAVVEVAMFLFV